MVPRTPSAAVASIPSSDITPFNAPRLLQVEADRDGVPYVVRLRECPSPVADIVDVWRIDDAWWRQEISRRFFRVALESGAITVIFQDLLTGAWFVQSDPD